MRYFQLFICIAITLSTECWMINPLSEIESYNQLFVIQTTDDNAEIVSGNEYGLNGINTPIGFTIKEGLAAERHLYLKKIPGAKEGIITTQSISLHIGGLCDVQFIRNEDYGYTVKEDFKLKESVPLYVIIDCEKNNGEVTVNPYYNNCKTILIGYTFP